MTNSFCKTSKTSHSSWWCW